MPEAATKKAVEPHVAAAHHSASVVADAVENGIHMAQRIGKAGSDAAEQLMEDTSERIRRHPTETVVMAFTAGVIVGGFISWCGRR